MRRLLKITNYAAQLMALIDLGKAIKRWVTKNDTKKQKTSKNWPSKKQLFTKSPIAQKRNATD